ncbi:MAG TPA: protein-disulfide reductase DsbD domain-containing protein [Steroidobacteraceae bacterium]|jgi:thiol:disulfide interchange protein DsbD|nr:protein-disulfide reductase DsbD domain-containing protein [Steroidobacteraceae bacterium]
MPMRTVKLWLLGLLCASPAAFPLSGNVVATDNVRAQLVSEVSSVGPGQSFWVALEFNIRDGWHTYWRNPGDSGQATTLKWVLPPGFTAGDIVWSTPHRFELPPLVNYGYSKHAVHLVNIVAPKDLKAGVPIMLSARAGWLVCADVCIPEDAELQLKLPAITQPGAVDPAAAALFAAARVELPSAAPAMTTARIQGDRLIIALGKEWGTTLPQIKSLAFFPYEEGGIEYAAPQTLNRNKDGLEIAMKIGDRPPEQGAVHGVLLASEQIGNGVSEVPMEIAAHFAGPGANAPAQGALSKSATPLPMLLLFAILGGLILNLMPCVFPVLSIKAIALVEQAQKHPAAVRAKGLVFAAGVVSSMLALAAVLLSLRAGGEQIGWGFQLQSPLFVTLLVYLLLAVGLNLSGVFEVGGGLAGVGDGLTQGDGYRASFFTGVLTTLVATPCTAPFMAFAVGAALTQPTIIALSIFAALGLGLALPYLLLSFAPWMRRALPKPGAWMDTLKQFFAFPIYASAAWLVWVLAQQTSSIGLGAALAGAILIALAAWAYQKSKSSSAAGRVAALVTATLAVLLAFLLPIRFADVAAASSSAAAGGALGAEEWQPFDAAQVAKLSAAGRPLLVNFTASWCLTCLVNERNAFADSAVQEVFRNKGVTLMKGDWTNRDPAITEALAAFGRAGVPLYLVYNSKPGSTEPLVLPQLLTASVVQSAFADTPAHAATP